MTRFMYALKSLETKRQYSRRLKVFLDFLNPNDISLDEQALQFLSKVRDDPRWFEDRFMDFIDFQLARVRKGEISESTIPNYYKPTKLFLEMNDVNSSQVIVKSKEVKTKSGEEVSIDYTILQIIKQ